MCMVRPKWEAVHADKGCAKAAPQPAKPHLPSGPEVALQRALGNCAYGRLQTKLTLGGPNDRYEQEAERVAERVMRMPNNQPGLTHDPVQVSGHRLQRCACGHTGASCAGHEGKTGGLLQRRVRGTEGSGASVPRLVHEVLRHPGKPLGAAAKHLVEPWFGYDFGQVRVHSDALAAQSAAEVSARAYTVGHHVVFGAGQYAPTTRSGHDLLAHELTHVVQQTGFRRSDATLLVQRQFTPMGGHTYDPLDEPRNHPPGAPGAVSCTPPSHCPAHFCEPYSSASYARHMRNKQLLWLLGGIRVAVDSRVVPLWRDHLMGGSAPRDLTSTFAADFTASRSTARTARFLRGAMETSLRANPPAFPAGVTTTTVDFASRLSTQLSAIDDPSDINQMNFNIPRDVAGNLAGGIGKDQDACRAGAMPSPFNDERAARVTAVVTRAPNGALVVQPSIEFTVRDTIDLCPGDCGTSLEQVATIPISQFEATGISGDVPFTAEFLAPALLTLPFIIPAPPPSVAP
jgi:hypothetical protein